MNEGEGSSNDPVPAPLSQDAEVYARDARFRIRMQASVARPGMCLGVPTIKFIRRRRQVRDVEHDLQGIADDVSRLGRHLRLGRTRRALMVVVDDEERFPQARETMLWSAGVDLLYAAPTPGS